MQRFDDDYQSFLPMYTARKMSHDIDSLNACIGILSHMRKTYALDPFTWGLPLHVYPQSLRWYHPTSITPRRRTGFPSWSWVGWEGEATYSDSLDLTRNRRVTCTDLTVRFLSIDNQVLILEGYIITLDFRSELLTDAYVPGCDRLVGIMQERNDVGTSLPVGMYDFLIVERSRFRRSEEESWLDHIYMLLLDWDGDSATRKTKVRLFVEEDVDVIAAGAALRTLKLK
jgi:hypothetical protein